MGAGAGPGRSEGLWAGGPLRARARDARSPGGGPPRSPDLSESCASPSQLDFTLRRSALGPCHAVFSPRCFSSSSSLCSCFPGLPGRARKVWWACNLSQSTGFVLSLLCGRLWLTCRNGLEKPSWGREARRSLLPLLFWSLCRCHLRSHSCSENIAADTQQDDLLAVIHGESSQTGFFPS